MENLNLNYLKEFIFKQKCIPWSLYINYHKIKNRILNINKKKYWDEVWSKEISDNDKRRNYSMLFNEILANVPLKSGVADIGCGRGTLALRLKQEKGCDVTGIDISKKAVDHINESGIKGFTAVVPPIPLPDNSFDVVVATELLEHVNKCTYLLKEMLRVVKPFGLIIVSVPDNALEPHLVREHVRTFTKEAIVRLFSNTKLTKNIDTVRIKEDGENFYRLIVKAKKCI